MIRRPPRSTQSRSSAASDVYKRQLFDLDNTLCTFIDAKYAACRAVTDYIGTGDETEPVSYTHLRAHETVLDLVCRLLLEKKKNKITKQRTKKLTTLLPNNTTTPYVKYHKDTHYRTVL